MLLGLDHNLLAGYFFNRAMERARQSFVSACGAARFGRGAALRSWVTGLSGCYCRKQEGRNQREGFHVRHAPFSHVPTVGPSTMRK